jgi:hypothetical protein
VRLAAVLLCCVLPALAAGPAGAAQIVTRDAKNVRLATDNQGRGLVTYSQGGRMWHVFYSGAINARQPSHAIPQVKFKVDYSGGRGQWKDFKNTCRSYDGPKLAFFLTGCKASDGSFWALQVWQRMLPNVGYVPWTSAQKVREVRISHWRGPLAQLELYRYWVNETRNQAIFGRASYLGQPVYGYRTSSSGAPLDDYGRLMYLDTLDSAYGPGWKREDSFVTHKGSGLYCYTFYPFSTYAGYPHQRSRALVGTGKRYRLTLAGPGVTPDVAAYVDGLPAYDAGDPALVDVQAQMTVKAQAMARLYGDRLCSG